ncbi:MAG: hypothetical protein AABX64_01645 [Nanoarchaeota archaeon]
MVMVNQVFSQIYQELALVSKNFAGFFYMVANKLVNFTKLALAEQIAYGVILVGLTLIITSIIMFLI